MGEDREQRGGRYEYSEIFSSGPLFLLCQASASSSTVPLWTRLILMLELSPFSPGLLKSMFRLDKILSKALAALDAFGKLASVEYIEAASRFLRRGR